MVNLLELVKVEFECSVGVITGVYYERDKKKVVIAIQFNNGDLKYLPLTDELISTLRVLNNEHL